MSPRDFAAIHPRANWRERDMSELGQVGSTSRWWQRLSAVQAVLAAALVALFLLPGLGSSGLLDPWEMDRAAVARRIAGSRQVLVIDRDGDLLKDRKSVV